MCKGWMYLGICKSDVFVTGWSEVYIDSSVRPQTDCLHCVLMHASAPLRWKKGNQWRWLELAFFFVCFVCLEILPILGRDSSWNEHKIDTSRFTPDRHMHQLVFPFLVLEMYRTQLNVFTVKPNFTAERRSWSALNCIPVAASAQTLKTDRSKLNQ